MGRTGLHYQVLGRKLVFFFFWFTIGFLIPAIAYVLAYDICVFHITLSIPFFIIYTLYFFFIIYLLFIIYYLFLYFFTSFLCVIFNFVKRKTGRSYTRFFYFYNQNINKPHNTYRPKFGILILFCPFFFFSSLTLNTDLNRIFTINNQ